MRAILETNLPLKLIKRGKVRDVYEIDEDRLLVVSTDRISAFDVVMADVIPGKGKVLNQLSVFWFLYLRSKMLDIKDHYIGEYIWDFGLNPKEVMDNDLPGRSMVVRRMDKVIPIECIVRGYIFKEKRRLKRPIFTPTTKAEFGHDEAVSLKEMAAIVGSEELAEHLEKLSRRIYSLGRKYSRTRGLDLWDTKFEFGLKDGEVFLIDELLTSDSSRYIDPKTRLHFDKQYFRDWLEYTGWDKESPPPKIPASVVSEIRRRYEEASRRLIN